MQSRITHVSYVLDFLDIDFNSEEISRILKTEVDKAIDESKIENLKDWEVQFRATYTNAKKLLVSKNRFGNYASDRYKEITIAIPVPIIDKVSWGVRKDQHIYKKNHYDSIIANFYELNIDFSIFRNRNEYILDCIRRVINFSFEKGFTVNKVKIKKT